MQANSLHKLPRIVRLQPFCGRPLPHITCHCRRNAGDNGAVVRWRTMAVHSNIDGGAAAASKRFHAGGPLGGARNAAPV